MAVVILVAFLTFAFSFLGTILCAVAIGMMMGGTRHARWQTLPMALVFPAVVLLLMRFMKTELAPRELATIALVCFGAFWFTYALTALLIFAEKKEPGAAPAKAAKVPDSGSASEAAADGTTAALPSPSRPAPAEELVELSPERLQGRWICPSGGEAASSLARKLDILDGQMVVSGLDADGQVRWLAKGKYRIERSTKRVVVLEESPGSSRHHGDRPA